MADRVSLLCVADDAQWLDQASAQCVAFVARRLLAESVLMLFVEREQSDLLRGLPGLVVGGHPTRAPPSRRPRTTPHRA